MFTVVVDIEESRARARAAGAARAAAAERRTGATADAGPATPPAGKAANGPASGPALAAAPAAGPVPAAGSEEAPGEPELRTEKMPLGRLEGRRDRLARALALWRARRPDGLIPRADDLDPDALAAFGLACRPVAVDGRPPFARFADERPDPAADGAVPLETPWLARDLLACATTRVPIFQRLATALPVPERQALEQLILPLSADGRRITRLLVCDQAVQEAESDARRPEKRRYFP